MPPAAARDPPAHPGHRAVPTVGADNQLLLNRKFREHGLTRREYEILRHVAMGLTNPEIAIALGLTRNTVKTYLQRTLEKLGAAIGSRP